MEKNGTQIYKSLIEKARNDPTIMMICNHEFLGDYGKFPPENWEPSEKEILTVIERSGFE